MKKITILATVMCCFVLASCGGGIGSNSPSAMVLKFYDYAKAGGDDMTKAITYFADNTDFGAMSEEEATEAKAQTIALLSGLSEKGIAEYGKKGGLKDFEITEETIAEDGLTAVVKGYTVYGNDEKGDESSFYFVKVDNNWKFKNAK